MHYSINDQIQYTANLLLSQQLTLLWFLSSPFRNPHFTYSCPSLVVPFFEELISRPFLDENRFRLVSQDRISAQNAIGYLFFHHQQLFSPPNSHKLMLLRRRFKWIYAWAGLTDLSDKQILESFFCTNLFEILTEQRGAVTVWGKTKVAGGEKTCSLYHSRHSYGLGTLIRIDFHPETAEK